MQINAAAYASGKYRKWRNAEQLGAAIGTGPEDSAGARALPFLWRCCAVAMSHRPRAFLVGECQHMSASPSKQSVQWLKTKVRELLVPSNTDPRGEVRDDLNRTLRGWSSYFNLGSSVVALRSVDHYVRERVRRFLAGRHKVAGRGTRRFTWDVIHHDRGVLCLERLPRPAPLWASR